jgi:hypothetical protein
MIRVACGARLSIRRTPRRIRYLAFTAIMGSKSDDTKNNCGHTAKSNAALYDLQLDLMMATAQFVRPLLCFAKFTAFTKSSQGGRRTRHFRRAFVVENQRHTMVASAAHLRRCHSFKRPGTGSANGGVHAPPPQARVGRGHPRERIVSQKFAWPRSADAIRAPRKMAPLGCRAKSGRKSDTHTQRSLRDIDPPSAPRFGAKDLR